MCLRGSNIWPASSSTMSMYVCERVKYEKSAVRFSLQMCVL